MAATSRMDVRTTIDEAGERHFHEKGFVVVRQLLPLDDVATIGQRVDDLVTGRTPIPQGESIDGRAVGVVRRPPGTVSRADPTTQPLPEEMLTERHARRGAQLYPVRRRPIDEAARAAALATPHPYHEVATIQYPADYDPVLRAYVGHPRIVAVLQRLLAPNVKLFWDHVYNKGPFAGPNRYHQDGFFMFSGPVATCWIALDHVTVDNGCFHYLPTDLDYGKLWLDKLGEAIGARQLAHDVEVELAPGDAVVHDRWAIHATGPNHTGGFRRGWALHYADAASRFVDDETYPDHAHTQTPDGRHWYDQILYGNRHYPLVCGREFPGCI